MPNESDSGVSFTAGIPETILPEPPPEASEALAAAMSLPVEERREAVSNVAAAFPRYIDAWAHLAGLARDDVEAYAYARVGYHRGLDALRGAGWRGSGYVRSSHRSNRGFLRALDALRQSAEAIGEDDEAERCATFLNQLDPRG